jgi:glutamate synthase (NADPH/NADH) small chain
VCPQEKQCEARCVLGAKGQPVSIGRLERYASDIALGKEGPAKGIPAKEPPTGKRAAIVGAGPAGLTAAGDLARLGHEVVVYDGLAKEGGVLRYGIPEFRLPNSIVDAEVQTLKDMGVQFAMNTLIGRSLALSELRRGFDSVFLGTGAGLPKLLGIPGEDLKGVYTANEFLTRVNLMRAD